MTRILWAHSASTSIGLAGEQFDQDLDGTYEIPERLVALAKTHGAKLAPVATIQEKPVPQWPSELLQAKAKELGLDVEGLKRPALIQADTAALNAKD